MTRAMVVAALAACSHPAAPPHSATPLRNATPSPSVAGWRLGEQGVGPLDAKSEATEVGLQRLLPGVRVTTTNLGAESGIVFDVFDGKDKLFYVVPDDAPEPENAPEGFHAGYAKTIFGIFATSPRVSVDGHAWRVGSKLDSIVGVTVCECWGDGEVTACWTDNPHIRLVFEERCDDARDHGPGALLGKSVGRIMWKREPDAPPQPGSTPP